jgi:hypothetical protein
VLSLGLIILNKKGDIDVAGIFSAIIGLFIFLAFVSVLPSITGDYKNKYDSCMQEKNTLQDLFSAQKNQTITCNQVIFDLSSKLEKYQNATRQNNTTQENVTIVKNYWQNVSVQFVFISIFFTFYFMIGLFFKLFDINIELNIEQELNFYMSDKWAKVVARLLKTLIILATIFVSVLVLNLFL